MQQNRDTREERLHPPDLLYVECWQREEGLLRRGSSEDKSSSNRNDAETAQNGWRQRGFPFAETLKHAVDLCLASLHDRSIKSIATNR